MPEIGDEFSVGGEFHEAVAGLRAADIHVAGAVGENRVLGFRPAWNRVRHPPGMQQVAGGVERHHGRRRHATFASRRVDGGGVLLVIEIARTVDHPDHVVLVDIHSGDAFEGPFVRQLLGPARIVFVFGRTAGRRRCLAARHQRGAAKAQEKHRDRSASQSQNLSIRMHLFPPGWWRREFEATCGRIVRSEIITSRRARYSGGQGGRTVARSGS
jgi:hypothetical protein